MDSSQSQHSDHPVSGSNPRSDNGSDPHSSSNSGSDSDQCMSMSSSDVGWNSVKTSSPNSARSNPPELHPQGDESESSGSLKTITSTEFEPEDQEQDVDIMDESTPCEEHKNETSATTNENAKNTGTTSGGSGSGSGDKPRGSEELGLLTDLYAFYNKFEHYQFTNDMQAFYDRQVHVYRNYATDQDVDNKLCELYDNYIKVVEKKVEFPKDPIDIDIIRHSSRIWGNDQKYPNDVENKTVDDDYGEFDKKYSYKQKTPIKDQSKQETGDSYPKDPKKSCTKEIGDDENEMKDPNDSSQKETGDDDLKDPIKGLSKQETHEDVDMKDSEDFRNDTKDSSGNEGGPSIS